jgi:hypothetical protein
MPVNDFLAHPKTEACSTESLGRKERLEGLCQSLRRHSWAIICNGQKDSVSPRSIVSVSTAKKKTATRSMHGVYCVRDQVAQHLANLSLKATDRTLAETPLLYPNVRIQDASLKDGKDAFYQGIAGYFGRARRLLVEAQSLIRDG